MSAQTQLHHVRIVLMKGETAQIFNEYLRDTQPDVEIVDEDTYYLLKHPSMIVLDADKISSYAGRQITTGSILVDFVTYVGRADITGNVISVSDEMLQLGDPKTHKAVA